LEVRPVYIGKESSKMGYAFVGLLSYMIIQKLREAWRKFDLTEAEGLPAK
jgi:transposase